MYISCTATNATNGLLPRYVSEAISYNEQKACCVFVEFVKGMLWPRDKFDVAYEQLKQDSLSCGCSVLIFVAPDVDALCAAHILTVCGVAKNCCVLNDLFVVFIAHR